MSEVIVKSTELEVLTCSECGIVFAVPAWWAQARREDHRGWKCPNGHGRVFLGETEEEKLRAKLDAARDREATLRYQRDHEARSARAYRGQVTRVKKRFAKGNCPCCGKHFEDLHKHMKNQHPQYAEEVESVK